MVVHSPRSCRYPQRFGSRVHLPQLFVRCSKSMVGFINYNKLYFQFNSLFEVSLISNCLYWSHTDRVFVITFSASSYYIMGDMIFGQALVNLINKFCSVCYDKYFYSLSSFYTVFVNVTYNRGKQACFTCTRGHLKHYIVHFIPWFKDFFLRLLLIRAKRSVFITNIRILSYKHINMKSFIRCLSINTKPKKSHKYQIEKRIHILFFYICNSKLTAAAAGLISTGDSEGTEFLVDVKATA